MSHIVQEPKIVEEKANNFDKFYHNEINSSGLKPVDQIIKENAALKNKDNLKTNFDLYKYNAHVYIKYIQKLIDNPNRYPYNDRQIARFKSIISS